MTESFRFLLRVRYAECDAQGIVFNARWGEYVDVAATEYTRALAITSTDWRLVKQTTEWRSPGRFDDVIELCVRTLRVGTTSFVLTTEARRHGEATPLMMSCETIYVVVDAATGVKREVSTGMRTALLRGAPGVVVDHAAARRPVS